MIGKNIDRYHILEQLGQGGMATVYKAYDSQLDRDVAIKVIRKEAFPPEKIEKILTRFSREAKALARLNHPNIIKVHDFGEFNNSPYLVMQYIPAGTLKEKLDHSFPFQEAAKILVPIAQALSYAHQQGVFHRDVKPSNILITSTGQAILSDFGIAKILESKEEHTLTGTGMGVGTPEYMAPEQGLGKIIDGRSDIYALGVVFYEMITGHKPYTADTPMAVIIKQINDPFARPRDYVPTLPDQVENVIFKALAKQPDDRYQSMKDFGDALQKLAVLPTVVDKPLSHRSEVIASSELDTIAKNSTPRKRQKKRNRFEFMGLVILLLAALISISIFTQNVQAQIAEKSTITAIAMETQSMRASQTEVVLAEISTEISDTGDWTPTPETTMTPMFNIGSTMIREFDGMEQVYVPAGEFEMGITDQYLDEIIQEYPSIESWWFERSQPVHKVYLDAFWIDKFEITNSQYKKCVLTGTCDYPTNTVFYDCQNCGEYPVVYVHWEDASNYCNWVGDRLPTEAEWEYAARGTQGNIYPWGNTMLDEGSINYNNFISRPATIGSFPEDVSVFGVMDLGGNVMEYVVDIANKDFYEISPKENPVNVIDISNKDFNVDSPDEPLNDLPDGIFHVVRGGSWGTEIYTTMAIYRSSNNLSLNTIGFRCVNDN